MKGKKNKITVKTNVKGQTVILGNVNPQDASTFKFLFLRILFTQCAPLLNSPKNSRKDIYFHCGWSYASMGNDYAKNKSERAALFFRALAIHTDSFIETAIEKNHSIKIVIHN
jgi:hypothetical protein